MTYRFVDKPAFEAAGWIFRTTTVNGENMREIPQFWDRCLAEGKVKALEPASTTFGIMGLCGDFDARGEAFTYIIGVEAIAGTVLPPGTQRVMIPAAHYAVFECVGPERLATDHGRLVSQLGIRTVPSNQFRALPLFPGRGPSRRPDKPAMLYRDLDPRSQEMKPGFSKIELLVFPELA